LLLAQFRPTDENLARSMCLALADELAREGGISRETGEQQKRQLFLRARSAAAARVARDYHLDEAEKARLVDASSEAGNPIKDVMDRGWSAIEAGDPAALWPGIEPLQDAMKLAARIAGLSEDQARMHTHAAFMSVGSTFLQSPTNRALADQIIAFTKHHAQLTPFGLRSILAEAYRSAGLRHLERLQVLAAQAEDGERLPEGLDADTLYELMEQAQGFRAWMSKRAS